MSDALRTLIQGGVARFCAVKRFPNCAWFGSELQASDALALDAYVIWARRDTRLIDSALFLSSRSDGDLRPL